MPEPLHRGPRQYLEYLRLSCVSIVVPEQTTEPFFALYFPLGRAYFSPRIDDLVPESLVVAFVVKVLAKLSEGSTQGSVIKEDYTVQTSTVVKSADTRSRPVGVD